MNLRVSKRIPEIIGEFGVTVIRDIGRNAKVPDNIVKNHLETYAA